MIGPITPAARATVGTAIDFKAALTDVDVGDTHSATCSWRGGSMPQAGTITESAGTGKVAAYHDEASAYIANAGVIAASELGNRLEVRCEARRLDGPCYSCFTPAAPLTAHNLSTTPRRIGLRDCGEMFSTQVPVFELDRVRERFDRYQPSQVS